MKYLKTKYKLFESEINDIIEKCKKYRIGKYEIGDDGLLTVFDSVDLSYMGLYKIPLKFKEVYGNYDISNNHITNFYGSPIIVGGEFITVNTNIKNLKYAPNEVYLGFFCGCNRNLISLNHFPKYVGGSVSLLNCFNLTSLYGCLMFIYKNFDLEGCSNLRYDSLKYGPNKVIGAYSCKNCHLISLYGAPEYVGGNFDCSYNKLTSLKYSPRYIGGDFEFEKNAIKTLNYFPDYVGGEIYCDNNPVHNVWKLFEDKEHIDYFNQMKIISDDGKKINIKRLNLFLKSIDKDSVEYVDGYENI